MQNTISNDKHDINVTPEDNPSNPSIRLIALVIPTIQQTVSIYEKTPPISIFPSINGIEISSILIPNATTIIAAHNLCCELCITWNPLHIIYIANYAKYNYSYKKAY